MFNFKILVALFVAICYNHVEYCHGAIQEVTKSHTFDGGILFERQSSFNGNLVYVICDSDTGPAIRCKVTQEKYPYDEISYSCPITLKEDSSSSISVGISALGENKAVLDWVSMEDQSSIVNIGTIDFETCEINRVKVPNSSRMTSIEIIYMTKLVPYDDDSFDVFYNDPRYHPESGDLYKIQIDGNGQIKSEPKAVNAERGRYFYASSVATRSPSKGYVYVKRNQRDLSRNPRYYLWLVKPDGTRQQLAQYNRSYSDVSAGNNFISLCNKPALISDFACTQYDEDGNVMFSTMLPRTGKTIDTIASFNRPNGGVLVMYGTEKCNALKGRCNGVGFEIVRIGLDGKKTGTLRTKVDIASDQVAKPYIYMNEDGAYCATVIVRDMPSDASIVGNVAVDLTIVSKCFTDDDFSA